eukprot:8948898-Pyramimonas_sp.AAC.1
MAGGDRAQPLGPLAGPRDRPQLLRMRRRLRGVGRDLGPRCSGPPGWGRSNLTGPRDRTASQMHRRC